MSSMRRPVIALPSAVLCTAVTLYLLNLIVVG
jgi:hypothetical protein